MIETPYRKDWQVSTRIARGMLGTEIGTRVPTISEYAQTFTCSRGIVQNALAMLHDSEAIQLNKQGKRGSFLTFKDEKKLIEYSGINYITASMSLPLNMHMAGLATGICQAMGRCKVPFTFAFVQGSKNRVDALTRGVYDFVVTTHYTAKEYTALNNQIEMAFPLVDCEYSPPYKLYINRPNLTDIQDGMTVAIDYSSTDHAELTKMACEGKNVKFMEMPYITANFAFYTGQVDCMVFRDGIEQSQQNLLNFALKSQNCVSTSEISAIPISQCIASDMQLPVVLINRNNVGIAGVIKNYLSGNLVGYVQERVIGGQMAPQFF
ncbi:MAG: YhfZ family protein [Oscillospiraceae bacterium]